ncbi:glutathione S-transferase [Erwinia sp. HR93]|uniref:glutathione S-transferase n=1 Tax=Erwinia sp. HR93 TaxID=3094840 RepID=UPI002ADEC5AB|nr:glutathione S-transferase [Erwinia sp. HR93]MEA1062967.1 glutathione S-transferase [Erwinia sp. HR93]
MKLVGRYTCPHVRKISIMLLEKEMPFELIDIQRAGGKISAMNPLSHMPLLCTDSGERWFGSAVISDYLEEIYPTPSLLPGDCAGRRWESQIEALADGIINVAERLVSERQRSPGQQLDVLLLQLRDELGGCLDWLEHQLSQGRITTQPLRLGAIAVGCAIGYLNAQRIAPGWCASRPLLVNMVGALFERNSFARTGLPG